MTTLVSGLIDVFAEAPLTGNPLAVVEGADALPDSTLSQIAREFNQAETTFILESTRADRRLRSFTATGSEVFGAGHNALGAWLWLGLQGQLGTLEAARTFQQEIGQDVLPITLQQRGGQIHGRMKQSALKLSSPFREISSLVESLALNVEDVCPYPAPRVADTGAGHLQVRLRDRAAVDRARPAAD